MNRREFFRLAAATTSVAMLPASLPGCDASPSAALDGWRGPPPDERDIRSIVLAYAILAPNSHNTQAWLIRFTGPRSLELYVDPKRLLPETDPYFRQIHIGQGTFLENLALAAAAHGHRADIRYFPAGAYGNTVLEPKPVAQVDLVPDAQAPRDQLFDAILERHSNKREYRPGNLTGAEMAGLRMAYDSSAYPFGISVEPTQRAALAQLLEEAMGAEVGNRARDLETIRMFRFSDQELESHRDGFGLAQSGMGPVMRWAVQTFALSRQSAEADPTEFGRGAVTLTSKQARSAAAFAWISSPGNTRLDQVRVGRAYERVNLTATRLGLAMHPMSQVLQEYADMAPLQRRFLALLQIPQGHTVQMLFRLGRAEPTDHTPRRQVDALLTPSA